jgi:hypothetical protein
MSDMKHDCLLYDGSTTCRDRDPALAGPPCAVCEVTNERDRLRAALEPFAAAGRTLPVDRTTYADVDNALTFTVNDLRRAAEALAPKKEPDHAK